MSAVAGSLAVRRIRLSAPVRTPGAMTPPMNRPSAVMQSKVVAVPKSTTIVSRANSVNAASVLTTRSAPTVRGSSTSNVIGSGLAGPTSVGVTPQACWIPCAISAATRGATDPKTAARTRPPSFACSRYPTSWAAHSSGVRACTVVNRHPATSSCLANSPPVISVLPMSSASSMQAPLWCDPR